MRLYHYSENPDIAVFHPQVRVPVASVVPFLTMKSICMSNAALLGL
jgi:hypothetical protein